MTYQTVYWVWVKLETDAMKDKKRSEGSKTMTTNKPANESLEEDISDLEAEVRRIRGKSSP